MNYLLIGIIDLIVGSYWQPSKKMHRRSSDFVREKKPLTFPLFLYPVGTLHTCTLTHIDTYMAIHTTHIGIMFKNISLHTIDFTIWKPHQYFIDCEKLFISILEYYCDIHPAISYANTKWLRYVYTPILQGYHWKLLCAAPYDLYEFKSEPLPF